MSVKHIDFLKIKPSKLLVVEIRPVRCVIDTPSGPTRTAKWMNHSHWKELHGLLNDIADVYEEQRNSIKVTQNVECNKPNIKVGSKIKIGYMFITFRKCSCHYLTPRDNDTWTDDEDETGKELKDKGGRYDSFVPCGEMLVVSVTLLESPTLNEQGLQKKVIGNHYDGGRYAHARSKMSPRLGDQQLLKVLDSSIVFTNTISDYFEASQKLSTESSVSDQVCTRANENSRSKRKKTLKNMVSKSRSTTKKQKNCSSTAMQSNFENENSNKRQVLKSIFDTQSDDSFFGAHEKNHFTLSRENIFPNESKASFTNKISYCDEGIPCTDDQILTDDLQSQKKNVNVQEECNWSELSEFNASVSKASVSCNDNKMRTSKKSPSDKLEKNILTTSQKLERNFEIEYEQKHSTENEFCQSENEQAFSSPENIIRSYTHCFSNIKDHTAKVQDSKIACLAAKTNKNANIGKLKPRSTSSPATSPVLGTSRSQVKKHLIDGSLFHPQVADESEGEKEPEDSGSQDCTQRDHRRREEDDATHFLYSDMSEDLPDLKQLSPTLKVRIPLECIDTKLSHYVVPQNSSEILKPSPNMKSHRKFMEVNEKKKMVFGDFDTSENKAGIKLLDSEYKISLKNMLDPYVEECYIPERVSPKCKQDHDDYLSSSLPKYIPSPNKKSQYCEKDDESHDSDTLAVRRSRRIKRKGESASIRKESLSEKSSFSSSVSRSPDLELDVASPVKRTPSKLKDTLEGTFFSDTSPNICNVKKQDISPERCKIRKKDTSQKKSTFSKSVSLSQGLESDGALPVKKKPSKLKDKFKDTFLSDISTKKCRERKLDISPKSEDTFLSDISTKKCKVRKLSVSPKQCEVRKKNISSKKCKVRNKGNSSKIRKVRMTHLSKETLRSMKDLEKCRKMIEQLEKESASKTEQQESTNDFSQESDSSISSKKPKKQSASKTEQQESTNDFSQESDSSISSKKPKKQSASKVKQQESTNDFSQESDSSISSKKPKKQSASKIRQQISTNDFSQESDSSISSKKPKKQSASKIKQQESTNDFSQESDSSISSKKPKGKVKIQSVPQNQTKLTHWISSRQTGKKKCQTFAESPSKRTTLSRKCVTNSKLIECKKNVSWKQLSIDDTFSETDEVSESENISKISCNAENNSSSIHKASDIDNIGRTSELTNSTAEHLTMPQDINIFDALYNKEEENRHSEKYNLSGSGTDETLCRYSPIQGRKLKLVSTDMNTTNLEEDTVMLHSKENSLTKPQEEVSQKDEDSVFVTHKEYSEDPSLQSLIHSYNRLQQMTIEELENRLKQALPYLRRVAKGQEPSKRHQVFKRGGREVQQMSDELIYGPYTEDKIICVIDFLLKNFSTVQDHDDQCKWRQYIWKVLAPTLLIKIVMENEEVTQDSAEKLLIEFSLNRRIRGCTNPSPI